MRGLFAGTTLAAAVLAAATFFGFGVDTSLAGIRLSSHTVHRPLLVALAGLYLWARGSERRQRRLASWWALTSRRATVAAFAMCVLVFIAGIRHAAFEAAAADSYGYVSQAHLWAAGHLVVDVPLAAKAPWPEAEWTLAPLGYRPGQAAATIVPIYSPGLPLVMAGLLVLFGPIGPFLAVPALGSVAIFATFLLGKRFAGSACGLMAAALSFTSPVFLFHLREPMSDVPVTALWILAVALITPARPAFFLFGGLAAAAAIATRPNLAPLAVVLASFVVMHPAAHRRARLRNALLFVLGVMPGCIGVAVLNSTLYGSPLASGYGSMSALFSVAHFLPNLARFPVWLVRSETPLILLAPAYFLLLRKETQAQQWPGASLLARLFAAFSLGLYACYAFYLPFDDWTFLRFLLPAIPLLLILCSATLQHAWHDVSSRRIRVFLAAVFVLFVAWRWDITGSRPPERRFATMGAYVRDQLPANAIVLSMMHSGSVRYYSGRLTLRWDWLPAEWLEPSLMFLVENGYHPILLIEDWERTRFVERFALRSELGTLNWAPKATYHGNARVDVFDLVQRGPTKTFVITAPTRDRHPRSPAAAAPALQ